MDRIFTELLPQLKKQDWVLAIKISENLDLFQDYPKTAFKNNPIEGIQDKLKQSIRELNGKTETLGEQLAFTTLQKIQSQPQNLNLLKSIHIPKHEFGIAHSVIIGDEGGLYMLLNSLNQQDK